MFCPQCGSQQSDEMRFCKICGANLQAVLQAMSSRDTEEKFDWSKTWVAEMFMSGRQRELYEAELERQRGITPEVKRYNEIKAGVITSSIGIAVTIFLYFLMQGVILSGNVPPGDAQIVSRVWVAGVIPFFVGLALIINGTFVSKKQVQIAKREARNELNAVGQKPEARTLKSADTSEFIPTGFSVTEDPTKHLVNRAQPPTSGKSAETHT